MDARKIGRGKRWLAAANRAAEGPLWAFEAADLTVARCGATLPALCCLSCRHLGSWAAAQIMAAGA